MSSKKRILVVDDEEQLRWMVKVSLENGGYEVIAAESGVKALEEAGKSKFDLFILDIMMPGLSGWDTLARLRELPSSKNTPVLMLSAKSTLTDVEQSLELGANDYVTKPFDVHTLNDKIKRLVGLSDSLPS